MKKKKLLLHLNKQKIASVNKTILSKIIGGNLPEEAQSFASFIRCGDTNDTDECMGTISNTDISDDTSCQNP